MAIRARIKSKLKSLLFGSSTNTSTNAVQSSPPPQTTFVPPNVSTTAASSSKPNKTDVTESVQKVEEQPAPESASSIQNDASEPTSSSEDSSAQGDDTADNPAVTETDLEAASYVFEITELFPETCPHCGASSQNNWIRIENKFACGSCEAAY